MIDFTSSLYLGWSAKKIPGDIPLTDGKPSILQNNKLADQIKKQIQKIVGLQAVSLAPSTLHLFTDIVNLFDPNGHIIYRDNAIYPAFNVALHQAKSKGIQTINTQHFKPSHLKRQLNVYSQKQRRYGLKKTPIFVATGWNPHTGKRLPIEKFVRILSPVKGWIIIDDTQAFGCLEPGGSGISRLAVSTKYPRIIVINSMAKAFGLPFAFAASNKSFIQNYEQNANSRFYHSPVSNWHLAAAQQILRKNRQIGNHTREELVQKVHYVKQKLVQLGFQLNPSLFPYVLLQNLNPQESIHYWKKLKQNGIQSILVKDQDKNTPKLVFLIRADHSIQELKKLLINLRTLKTKVRC